MTYYICKLLGFPTFCNNVVSRRYPCLSWEVEHSPRGTLRVEGKRNSLFPVGSAIKCLLFTLPGGRGFTVVGG